MSAAAAIINLLYTLLNLVSQRSEPCGRRCSVRPHTVRRPRLALSDCAATQVAVSLDRCTYMYIHLNTHIYIGALTLTPRSYNRLNSMYLPRRSSCHCFCCSVYASGSLFRTRGMYGPSSDSAQWIRASAKGRAHGAFRSSKKMPPCTIKGLVGLMCIYNTYIVIYV